MKTTPGFVSLVGAGPGDPDLLTVKAVRRLAQADEVLHDALIDSRVLQLATGARCRLVGGRAGSCHDQDSINASMIALATAGARVVRLKGGDPFVFGHGGEEAGALARARIAFEVVPGVSSVTAAPGLAGIPLTHRGLASGFAVITGHAELKWVPILDSIAPGTMTLVFMMGLSSRSRIAQALLDNGWPDRMPAAIVLCASTARQRVWRGTLAQLQTASLDPDRDGPGVIVIGEVVSCADIDAVGRSFAAIA